MNLSTITTRFTAFELIDVRIDLIVPQVVIPRRLRGDLGPLVHIAVDQLSGDDTHQLRGGGQEVGSRFGVAAQLAIQKLHQGFIGTCGHRAGFEVAAHGFGGQTTGQGVQGNFLGAAVVEAALAEVAHGVEQHAGDYMGHCVFEAVTEVPPEAAAIDGGLQAGVGNPLSHTLPGEAENITPLAEAEV